MGGNSAWSGGQGCQQGREEEKSETRERMMRMNWEGGAGASGSFHTPIYSTKTRGLARPPHCSRRSRGGRGGKTGLVRGLASCVQACGGNRDVSLGMFCALR